MNASDVIVLLGDPANVWALTISPSDPEVRT